MIKKNYHSITNCDYYAVKDLQENEFENFIEVLKKDSGLTNIEIYDLSDKVSEFILQIYLDFKNKKIIVEKILHQDYDKIIGFF